ncbi:uncharacterized protein LOC135707833 [Ochlerotatus camptorhynchus]|uniref:uncharacterized protein LOC135707833 n=1 Tax=Ochlerotatus camptorhynchus TaxID=644619 RepID=UPI0031D90906
MEITTRQTAENLRLRVEEVLKLYDSGVVHIYSCTTDNGKNMLKCVRELNKSQHMALDSETELSYEDMFNNEEEKHDEYIANYETAQVDQEVDEMLEAVESIFLHGNESCIATLKCVAHTINLVVKDVINGEDESLKKIRKIVKFCRKTEYKPFFDLAKVPLPKIDVETRWGSMYEMVACLYAQSTFYKDLGCKFDELRLTEDDWDYVIEFSCAFEHVYGLTKNLQSDDLILGDVYKFVKMCQLKLKQVPPGNRFSEKIVHALTTRATVMMDNNAFRAALLFDQRWCFIDSPYVTTDDKLAAIEHILKVSNILTTFNTRMEQQPGTSNQDSKNPTEDDLEALLEEECQQASTYRLCPSQTLSRQQPTPTNPYLQGDHRLPAYVRDRTHVHDSIDPRRKTIYCLLPSTPGLAACVEGGRDRLIDMTISRQTIGFLEKATGSSE